MQEQKHITINYLFFTFLKIGAISWGGYMALIAVIQKQLVDKDKVIREETILDGISLASILPGAISINVATYIGYQLRGIRGALASLTGVVLPGVILITLLAALYSTFGELPLLHKFFTGILPAVAALILSVAIQMAQKQIKGYQEVIIALLAASGMVFINSFRATLLVIFASGVAGFILFKPEKPGGININQPPLSPGYKKFIWYTAGVSLAIMLIVTVLRLTALENSEWFLINKKIFLTFSGMSMTLFGGGYVIIPAMHTVIVDGFHWLSTKEFADAIAMGQITPGPVILTATFIGYRVAGFTGALVSTIAIFIPPGILMVLLSGFIKKVKDSPIISKIFQGMRPAIIGMIFSATYTIGKSASPTWPSAAIFLITLFLLLKYKIKVVYLIPLAGIAGIGMM